MTSADDCNSTFLPPCRLSLSMLYSQGILVPLISQARRWLMGHREISQEVLFTCVPLENRPSSLPSPSSSCLAFVKCFQVLRAQQTFCSFQSIIKGNITCTARWMNQKVECLGHLCLTVNFFLRHNPAIFKCFQVSPILITELSIARQLKGLGQKTKNIHHWLVCAPTQAGTRFHLIAAVNGRPVSVLTTWLDLAYLTSPLPARTPAMLSRATAPLTTLGFWTTPNKASVSSSPNMWGTKIAALKYPKLEASGYNPRVLHK